MSRQYHKGHAPPVRVRGPFFVLRKIARIWLPTARYIEIDVQSSIDAIKKDLLSNGLADTFSGLTTKGGLQQMYLDPPSGGKE